MSNLLMHSVSVWIGTESIFGLKPGYRFGKEPKNKLDKFVLWTNWGKGLVQRAEIA